MHSLDVTICSWANKHVRLHHHFIQIPGDGNAFAAASDSDANRDSGVDKGNAEQGKAALHPNASQCPCRVISGVKVLILIISMCNGAAKKCYQHFFAASGPGLKSWHGTTS